MACHEYIIFAKNQQYHYKFLIGPKTREVYNLLDKMANPLQQQARGLVF